MNNNSNSSSTNQSLATQCVAYSAPNVVLTALPGLGYSDSHFTDEETESPALGNTMGKAVE